MRVFNHLTVGLFVLAATAFFSPADIGLISSAGAQSDSLPAVWQRKVQQTIDNIDQSRQSLAANGVADMADAFKAKQWRDRIESYRSVLAKVPASSDPLLASALEKQKLLEAEFAAISSGSPAPAASSSSSTSASADTPSTPTPTATAAAASPSGPQLVSGQKVQVKKLIRDITNTRNDMVTTGPSPLQDPAQVERYKQRLDVFAQGVNRFVEFGGDPDVQQAAAEYEALREALQAEAKRAEGQMKEIGNAQAILAHLEQTMRANPVPTQLYPPFTQAEAREWVILAATAQQTAQQSAAEIQRIVPLAYLPETRGTIEQGAAYDGQDVDRLMRWANGMIEKANNVLAGTRETLKQRFDNQNEEYELGVFRKLDPENESDRMNMFLKEGAQEEVYGRLDDHLALAESVAAFETALDRQPTAEMTGRIAEIKSLRKTYAENRQKALGDSRLPEPKSTDEQRIAAAKEILANPEYEFGQHGPIVLTTPEILTKEEEVSRETIKDVDVSLSGTITLSGTRETWNYKWEEFKFATPLKETNSDEWYIWWITAKKYQSGWERTPIGYWVSGAAVKGDLILEENF